MIQIKLLIILCLSFAFFSCQDNQEREVGYSETFNIDELEDSPESDEDFLLKYGEFVRNTAGLYDIEDEETIEMHSTFTTDSDGLNQRIDYIFEHTVDDFDYFIQNNLIRFHDINDVEKGWDVGEDAFWSGVLRNNLKEENFKEFKNDKINSLGAYSEYSELPMDDKVMVILHIKWRKIILNYSQVIESEMMDEYIEKIEDNFEQIKDAYGAIDQNKIDQLLDKALEDVQDQVD